MIEQKHVWELSKSRNLKNLLRLLSQLPDCYSVSVTDGSGRKGIFYYSDNLITGAFCHNLTGEQALKEMLSWGNAVCQLHELEDVPDKKIEIPLSLLLEKMNFELPSSSERSSKPSFYKVPNSNFNKENRKGVLRFNEHPLNINPGEYEEVEKILKTAVRSLGGFVLACITTIKGVPVVAVNSRNTNIDYFSKISASLMITIGEALKELESDGITEYMVRHRNGWLVSHSIGVSQYCLVLAVNNSGQLGIVRLIARKIVQELKMFLKLQKGVETE